MPLSPIIIIAAGRSGSKLLRSIIATHRDVVHFPREINYIWRFGNSQFPTDELTVEHARPEVVAYIRKRFADLSLHHENVLVLEKTCANSLRVDFVKEVFPEAKLIHLVRDGHAVAESARRRWQAGPEWRYLLEKMRWVPLQDVPYYGIRYFKYQFGRLKSKTRAQTSWGPRFTDIDDLVSRLSLIEVCGIQWSKCVQAATRALGKLPRSQVLTIRYEDLVKNPMETTQTVFDHIGLQFEQECQQFVLSTVKDDDLTKWRQALSDEDVYLLRQHITPTLSEYGYIQA